MNDKTCKTCGYNDDLLCDKKESGSLMIIAATNGSQKRRYIGVTACCSIP